MSAEAIAKKVSEHLEFLGYELTDINKETGLTFIARHPNKSDFNVVVTKYTTLLVARWGGTQKKALRSIDFFETMNSINQETISKWFFSDAVDDQIAIVVEGVYYDYDKSLFGLFVDNLESETQLHLPKFGKFSVKK